MDVSTHSVSTKDWLKASKDMKFLACDLSSRSGSSTPVEVNDDSTKKVSERAQRKVGGKPI